MENSRVPTSGGRVEQVVDQKSVYDEACGTACSTGMTLTSWAGGTMGPFAHERERYLCFCASGGAAQATLLRIARELLVIASRIDLSGVLLP